MNIIAFEALACPLDGDPLHCEGGRWRCGAGHSFDVARQGYVHLLPVQQKRSRDPGDSKQMVAARQRFLNAGYYQPIAAAINAAVLADSPAGARLSCLDAGCGEGYYLRQLAALQDKAQTLALLGLDISKWAILAAAKQHRGPRWVVGSNANLPVQSGSLDRILCMFGFPVFTEFARVLKPAGRLLQVDAGPYHLRQLREIIYPELKPERPLKHTPPEGFSALSAAVVTYTLQLTGAQQVADLLAMTPHLHRASAEGRAKAAALTSCTVTIDVRLTCLARENGQTD